MGVRHAPLKQPARPPVNNGASARGPFQVVAYEGPAAAQLGAVGSFSTLCTRGGAQLIDEGYIGELADKAAKHRRSTFLLAVHDAGRGDRVAALAQCTLRGSMPGFRARRIVFVDLVCSDEGTRGAGAVLLGELERYARSLGARVVALQSVLAPAARQAYARRGYVRGAGNRSDEAVRVARLHYADLQADPGRLDRLLGCVDAECEAQMRQQLERVLGARKDARASRAFLQALQGEFYPPYNTLFSGGDAVAMFKALDATSRPSVAVDWQGEHAAFLAPQKRQLATYAPDAATHTLRRAEPRPSWWRGVLRWARGN